MMEGYKPELPDTTPAEEEAASAKAKAYRYALEKFNGSIPKNVAAVRMDGKLHFLPTPGLLDNCIIGKCSQSPTFPTPVPILAQKCEFLDDEKKVTPPATEGGFSTSLQEGTNEVYTQVLTDAGRMELLECLRLKKSLPECLTANPHITAGIGNDYQENSTYKVKVLLYKPDICKLMEFIARAVMESDRCKICPNHSALVDYTFLQKAYMLLGQQLGTRGWDLLPFQYIAKIERVISIWCPGFDDFAMKLQQPNNCFYAQEKYLDAEDVM